VPEIIGFLLTGIMAGPYGLGIFTNMQEIDFLAELGIVLLFVHHRHRVLLQKDCWTLKNSSSLGGTLQVLLTFAAAFVIALALGALCLAGAGYAWRRWL